MEQKLRTAGRPRGFDEATARGAIRDAFWERGFAATSLDDLSTATGLHKPSLYGAFGNKQAMFTDSFKAYLREMGAAMTAALAEPKLADALAAHFTSATRMFLGNDAARGCFMASAAVPQARSDADVAARIRRAMAALEDAFRARLVQAEAAGELSSAFDPQAAADLLLGTHLRLSVMARSGEPETSLTALWQRTVKAVVRPV